MVSVSVRSLFHQPMDGKKKTWTLCFPAKETLIWRRHCSIEQSCCSMTSKQFLESSSGMKFVYPSVRLTNQKPGAFVSVRYTNQIALFPFVCCFCFVRAFSFQGHTKIALIPIGPLLFRDFLSNNFAIVVLHRVLPTLLVYKC